MKKNLSSSHLFRFLFPALLGALLFCARPAMSAVLVQDDFINNIDGNQLGGAEAAEGDDGSARMALVSTVTLGNSGYSREIKYYNPTSGSQWYRSQRNANLSTYRYVSFWIRGAAGGEDLNLLVDDANNYPKVRVKRFLPGGVTTDWQKVVISTQAFQADALNWAGGTNGSFKIQAESSIGSGNGTVYIDDIRYGLRPAPVWWENFDAVGPAHFIYGMSTETWLNNPGGIVSTVSCIITSDVKYGSAGSSLRVDFSSGPVGSTTTYNVLILVSRNNGMDVTGSDKLSFQVKGDSNGYTSGQDLGISLKDGTLSSGWDGQESKVVNLSNYLTGGVFPTSSFQEVRIPLSDFNQSPGVSTTAIRSVNVWFQKGDSPLIKPSTAAFTVFFDNIRFIDTSTPTAPSELKSDGVAVGNNSVFGSTSILTITAQTGAADPTLEHVGVEYSTDGAFWHRIAVDTDTADTSYRADWHTTSIPAGNDYRVRAFAEDVQGNRGLMSVYTGCRVIRGGSAQPPANISDLTALTGTNDGEVLLKWTAPGDSGTTGTPYRYVLKASANGVITNAAFDSAATYTAAYAWPALVSGTQAEQRLVTGLTPGVTYWFAIKAEAASGNLGVWNSSMNVTGINTLSVAAAQDLIPIGITSLTAAPYNTNTISLLWVAPSTPVNSAKLNDYDYYVIYRATSPFTQLETFVSSAIWTYDQTLSTVAVLGFGLEPSSTYYYRIGTADTGPVVKISTSLSPIASACPSLSTVTETGLALNHTPLTAVGILGQDIRLTAVVQSTKTIEFVRMFYRKKGESIYTAVSTSPVPAQTSMNVLLTIPKAVVTTAGLEYYLSASDNYNIVSFRSADVPQFVSVTDGMSSPDFLSGTLTLSDGDQRSGQTSITVPPDALPFPINLTISQQDVSLAPSGGRPGGSSPVTVAAFGPSGTKFQRPVTVTLRYVDVDPKDGIVDGTGVKASELKTFWYDEILAAWRPVGGKVDGNTNTVGAKAAHFTLFGLFPANLRPEDSMPRERIITPNGDGINDTAAFDNLPDECTIRISDLRGRHVRTLHNVNVWDGRDDSGDIVTNGVYIYQFRVNVETVTGRIGVAR